MAPLPPQTLSGVAHFFFTVFGIPVTVAYFNLAFWIVVIVVFVMAAVARLPRFLEGGE